MKLKKLFFPFAVLFMGLLLIAATSHQDWLESHWHKPAATTTTSPHGWPDLEKNLAPEACAQCHAAQFSAWKESFHAHAYSPGLIGQFPHMGISDSNDCLKCHAPLAEQKLTSITELSASLKSKLIQPEGFDRDGKLDGVQLPLRHAGVTCAACHVRGWQRFGPPQRSTGAVGHIEGGAHGGFNAVKKFESSQFCASCHQFPQAYAINGKPMENTVAEWQQSRFPREGVQCQTCHMPDRKHEFKGIHDIQMVRKGLVFESSLNANIATFKITSKWIGHAFPTYVTPKVLVHIQALDQSGLVLKQKEWVIERKVEYRDGWQEISDTRLLPGESRMYVLATVPASATVVRFSVEVIPDNFYKGVYESLLSDALDADATQLINQALKQANLNDYQLYQHEEVR
ncbi:MAG: multiheme c-type cytochrome [Mariprofundus sp.]|nr:multiheme c-type cytochrome [Mariprofundus sp.]